jgi:hypothetical protein
MLSEAKAIQRHNNCKYFNVEGQGQGQRALFMAL